MPTILLIGTADTKADEILFLKKVIESGGGKARIMDVGVLGKPPFKPDYSKHDVADAASTTNHAIANLGDENLAMTKTAEGASKLCLSLHKEGKIDGVLLLGGTMGTDLALDVTAGLPLGFPKMIISTVAFSHLIPPERLAPDVMMILWSGGLYGLNSICKSILSQAAGAVLGAAKTVQEIDTQKPVIAMSSLGSSALKYMVHLKPELEKRGYELAVFHTTGQGGRALESLASQQRFVCVLDFSLQEVVNDMKGSIVSSGSSRLEAATKAGIPQIIAPGATDLIDVPTWKTLPPDFEGRPYHAHNRLIASVTMTAEERREAARLICQKLSKATAPVKLIMPLQGIEEWDRKGNDLHDELGLAALADEFRKVTKEPVELIELDAHINDEAFAQKVLDILDVWIDEGVLAKGVS